MPEVMSADQVAQYLSLPLTSVIEMLEAKQIPGVRIGGVWRVRLETLNSWIDDDYDSEEDFNTEDVNSISNERVKSKVVTITHYGDAIVKYNKYSIRIKPSMLRGEDKSVRRGDILAFDVFMKDGKYRATNVTIESKVQKASKKSVNNDQILLTEDIFTDDMSTEEIYLHILQRMRSYENQGDVNRANYIASELLVRFSNDIKVYSTLIGFYKKHKNFQKIVDIMEIASEKFPENLQEWYREKIIALLNIGTIEALNMVQDLVDSGEDIRIKEKVYADKLSLIDSNSIVKNSINLFYNLGFSYKIGRNEARFIDFILEPTEDDYFESYGIRGKIVARCYKYKPRLEEIDDFLNNIRNEMYEGVVGNIGFMIYKNPDNFTNKLKDIRNESIEVIIPLDVNNLINNDISVAKSKLIDVLNYWITQRDLFKESFPVLGRQFFGRDQVLRQISNKLENGGHVGIYGLRKSGKTSILYKLKESKLEDIVIHLDLQNISPISNDCRYIYWQIANELYNHVKFRNNGKIPKAFNRYYLGIYNSFADTIDVSNHLLLLDNDIRNTINYLNFSGRRDSKIILVLDELELMLPINGNGGFRDYKEFFTYVRGLSQNSKGRVNSVVVAANALINEIPRFDGSDNPVFQMYTEYMLPNFSIAEMSHMITTLGKGMGISFANSVIDTIYKDTGGHPYLTRELCSFLAKDQITRPASINMSTYKSLIDSFVDFQGPLFYEILERLSTHFSQEYNLLLEIGGRSINEKDLISKFGKSYYEVIKHLVGYNLISFKDGKYTIKINLLERYLRRNGLSNVG